MRLSFLNNNKMSDAFYAIKNTMINTIEDIDRMVEIAYDEGFKIGCKTMVDIQDRTGEQETKDFTEVKKFAKWCYIHGKDFSYMGNKYTGAEYVEKILNEYKDFCK